MYSGHHLAILQLFFRFHSNLLTTIQTVKSLSWSYSHGVANSTVCVVLQKKLNDIWIIEKAIFFQESMCLPFARVLNLKIVYCHVFLKTLNLSMCAGSSTNTIKFNLWTPFASFCHVLDIFPIWTHFSKFWALLAVFGIFLCFLGIMSLDSAFWHFWHFLVLKKNEINGRKKMCQMSHGTCHVSPFTCLMSHVTYHLSPITYQLSPITCHLSLSQPPQTPRGNSSIIHTRLFQ